MPRKVTPTYVLLNQITLAAASSSVTFSSIPQNYEDLVIVLNGSPADTAYPVNALRFNGDSGNNYSYVGMSGTGSGTGSGTNSSMGYASLGQAYGTGPSTSSRFATVAQIFDYSEIDKHKTMLSRNNVSDAGTEAQVVRWASTSAITSISVITSSGAGYATGTTFSLYGIVA
jgi:hypothetical protein